MLTTENSAREKWCPFVRISGSNRLYNEKTDGFKNAPHPYHCIAGECMAWRELHYSHVKGGDQSLEQHGYCGLAERPYLE